MDRPVQRVKFVPLATSALIASIAAYALWFASKDALSFDPYIPLLLLTLSLALRVVGVASLPNGLLRLVAAVIGAAGAVSVAAILGFFVEANVAVRAQEISAWSWAIAACVFVGTAAVLLWPTWRLIVPASHR